MVCFYDGYLIQDPRTLLLILPLLNGMHALGWKGALVQDRYWKNKPRKTSKNGQKNKI